MTDKRLCIYQIDEAKIGSMDLGRRLSSISVILSRYNISWDSGQAIYYSGFDNHFALIGMLRNIMSEPLRNAILQTIYKQEDYCILGIEGYVVIWSGGWTPLERAGLISLIMNQSKFQVIANDILKSVEANNGKLVDRT